MARTDPQVNFRIPADLKTRLDAAADSAGRSLTAEIVLRLQQSLEAEDKGYDVMMSSDSLVAMLKAQEEQGRRLEAIARQLAARDRPEPGTSPKSNPAKPAGKKRL
jgi:uncharacterized protein (DUF1778 family)